MKRIGAIALVVGAIGLAASGAASGRPGDALAVRDGDGWITWWERNASPDRWGGDAPLADEVAWQAGADDYLRKPFDPEELVMRVEALVGKHQAQQELYSESFPPNGTSARAASHPR